jgi:hypothetical protein
MRGTQGAAWQKLAVLGDGRFDGFGVGTIDDVNLLPVLEVVEGRNRSDSFSLHKLRSVWRGIPDYLDDIKRFRS